MIHFAPLRKSGVRGPGKFYLWNPEKWALEYGIQLKESGIPLTSGIRNPPSIDKECGTQYMEPRIRNLQIGIQNPRLRWTTDGLHEEIQG